MGRKKRAERAMKWAAFACFALAFGLTAALVWLPAGEAGLGVAKAVCSLAIAAFGLWASAGILGSLGREPRRGE